MTGTLIIAGTDTGIGKTVVAAGLAAALDAYYWKPIQSGTEEGTDSGEALTLGVPRGRILPEAYRLDLPASPHLSAEREGVTIQEARLALPTARPLIVEGAGGLLVPVRREPMLMQIDLFVQWRAPVLLVTRTGLGTINHSLLSIEALRARNVAIAGMLFVGESHPDNEVTLPALSGVRSFGRLPPLPSLNAATLRAALHDHIDLPALRSLIGQSS